MNELDVFIPRKITKPTKETKLKVIVSKDPIVIKYNGYIKRAKEKGILMDINFIYLISLDCNYCGSKATGLDKLNSKGDYNMYNVVPCCYKCNTMKFVYSGDEFLEHIKKIMLFYRRIG